MVDRTPSILKKPQSLVLSQLLSFPDHTYTMIEEAQAQAEEVKAKEVRTAKFQYTSITFDTFKPGESGGNRGLYQPEVDEERQQRQRLPSFARNYNPTANRAMLARSYEVVTPMNPATAAAAAAGGPGGATNQGLGDASGGFHPEEYHKLMHQERKMTGVSQRNFSISTKMHDRTATNYSQLMLKPSSKREAGSAAEAAGGTGHAMAGEVANVFRSPENIKLPPQSRTEEEELGVKKIKPVAKKRTLPPREKPIPSYSLVQKPKAPPLPPRASNEDWEEKEAEEEEERDVLTITEGHYNVPRSLSRRDMARDSRELTLSHYDQPSSLRVAWSCENIGTQSYDPRRRHAGAMSGHTLYDTPTMAVSSSALGPRVVCSQLSLRDAKLRCSSNFTSSNNSASMESYIDMSGSHPMTTV